MGRGALPWGFGGKEVNIQSKVGSTEKVPSLKPLFPVKQDTWGHFFVPRALHSAQPLWLLREQLLRGPRHLEAPGSYSASVQSASVCQSAWHELPSPGRWSLAAVLLFAISC